MTYHSKDPSTKTPNFSLFGHGLRGYLTEPLGLLAVIWLLFIIDLVLPGSLSSYGIRPRSFDGLIGIVFAPFLHANLWHIVSNSLPLLVLAILVRVHGRPIFWRVSLGVILVGGTTTWAFSSAGVVVGASGLVFGYWAFLIAFACYSRSLLAILLGGVTVLLYGTLLFSLFRYSPNISWVGHASGALAGVLLAKFAAAQSRPVPD